MACLIKDSKGRSPYYYACYDAADGRRIKKSTKQTDRKKAWEVLLTMMNAEDAIAKGSATEQQLRKVINDTLTRLGERRLQEPTIRELLDGWIQDKRGSASETTLRAYQHARDSFIAFLGPRSGRSVRLLKKSEVVEFRQHLLSEGRTPTTVNNIKVYLAGPFESARKEGLLDHNPFSAVKSLKATTVEKDTFSPAMVSRLVEAACGTDWEGAVLVGYTTGARLNDVANLRWSDIDTENGVISFVQRKTGKRALIGLHDELRDWIVRQPAPNDAGAHLFPTLANRPAGGSYGLSTEFSALMVRAGIEPKVLRAKNPGQRGRTVRSLTFHSFRHGAATAVFKNAALKDIARRVTAHTSRGVLDRYIHEDIEAIREATNLIPRLPKA